MDSPKHVAAAIVRHLSGDQPIWFSTTDKGERRFWVDDLRLSIAINGKSARKLTAPARPGSGEEPPRTIKFGWFYAWAIRISLRGWQRRHAAPLTPAQAANAAEYQRRKAKRDWDATR